MKKKISLLVALILSLSCLFSSTLVACKQCAEHKWNNGELVNDKTIKYTCEVCEKTRKESVSDISNIVTREQLEKAVVETAWAYYMKGTKVQYDSISLSKVNTRYGGLTRHVYEVSPEYGTSDTTIYSVCTDFTCNSYYEGIGRKVFEGVYSPGYVLTFWHWMAADNQPESGYKPTSGEIDAITENDRDMALVRWINYDKYAKNNAWELPYCDELQVFSSSAFTDWYGKKLELRKDGNKYSYYKKNKQISYDDAKELVCEYVLEQKNGKYVNLRPGDVFVEDGHALIYIGGDRVLDCGGDKYVPGNGTDKVEKKGAIYGRMKTVESVVVEDMSEDFVLVRPLDYYAKDYDGKPENDIIMFNGESIKIPEKTLSRMEYPAMDIDRTVNITPYGTAVNGEELTYNIKIANNTTEANYCKWRGNGYNGQEYKGLTVTETIPNGTEFVSANNDAKFENGKLSWTLNIPAGQSVELTYTVKVIAESGSIITNDNGFVANIPSNSISNLVGGAKLNAEQTAKLTELVSDEDTSSWKTTYGTDTAFANSIYKKMGIDLELPTVQELVENLFTPTRYDSFMPLGKMYNESKTPVVMFTPNANVGAEYEIYQKMLINGYYGGYRYFDFDTNELAKVGYENLNLNKEMNTTIKEFKHEFLEVGDIIVYATAKNRGDTSLTSEMQFTNVMVYVGDRKMVKINSDGEATILTNTGTDVELISAFWQDYDIFFALRPSQAN